MFFWWSSGKVLLKPKSDNWANSGKIYGNEIGLAFLLSLWLPQYLWTQTWHCISYDHCILFLMVCLDSADITMKILWWPSLELVHMKKSTLASDVCSQFEWLYCSTT